MNFTSYAIATVIHAYLVERDNEPVLQNLPAYIKYVLVADDASPDHEKNQDMGGVMVSGFRKAIELGAQTILCVILGIQILLSAIEIDMNSTPRKPLLDPLEENNL